MFDHVAWNRNRRRRLDPRNCCPLNDHVPLVTESEPLSTSTVPELLRATSTGVGGARRLPEGAGVGEDRQAPPPVRAMRASVWMSKTEPARLLKAVPSLKVRLPAGPGGGAGLVDRAADELAAGAG